jgi:SWI/SNF-related matrix-associated actin-dependent regulator 1 of chromatin subfamily A
VAVIADGSVPAKQRRLAQQKFDRDKKCRLFMGQVDAAGVGITLTTANTVMFAEMNLTPSKLIQAEDRCHRIGQKRTVMIYYLVGKNTIDTELAEIIKRKQDVVTRILDGKGKIEDLELDILSMLEQYLEI